MSGLSDDEAARRLAENGPNELIERGRKSAWRIAGEQLTGTLVLVLLGAVGISAALRDYQDAAAILAIVVLNAALGFSQERRAEKAIAALKKLAAPNVKVWRGGRIRSVPSRELVPGDVVLLEAGNSVPADGRLLESVNLRVQEAALTGESQPVEKDFQAHSAPETPLAERRDQVYQGTLVAYGRGTVLILQTGMRTELGRLADALQKIPHDPTPLQRRLEELARRLALAVLLIAVVVFVLGLWRGEDVRLMFLTAVSIAVAAVPEGLPAVVTIALALGAQRMLKRRALVRKLAAVETLGSVTVICTDKTGTLTENRMTVTMLDVAGHELNLTEPLRWESGAGLASALRDRPALALLLAGGALCNEALVVSDDQDARGLRAVGDPTEAALMVAAARFGLWKAELERMLPRFNERPFDSQRKRMSTFHRVADGGQAADPSPSTRALRSLVSGIDASAITFTKGSVDGLLEISSLVWADDHSERLDERWRERIISAHDRLAEKGMRVMGVAFKPEPGLEEEGSIEERDLTFVGLVGMLDPPRREVKEALAACREAGIRVMMVTGDHPLTARAIAEELGMRADRMLTGKDLDRLPPSEWGSAVEGASVFARVVPEHKLRIVQALQARGHIVAMTGDGVNDAPALKKADIGVAMGLIGTDVSREAADMVLLDDNFATIVAAVREGRVIYDNIRKFVKYLLTTNAAEIWVMLLGPLMGMPLPLLPLQILWINLVTDGPPALALSLEPAEGDSMRRPPRSPQESIFGRGVGGHMIWAGLFMAVLALLPGYLYWRAGRQSWQTMIFATLTFSQLANVLAIRAGNASLFKKGLPPNRALYAAVGLIVALQLAVIYLPLAQTVLRTSALNGRDLGISLLLGVVIVWAVEIEKWAARKRDVEKETGGRRHEKIPASGRI